MKTDQLIDIEEGANILARVLSKTNGTKVSPLEILDELIGSLISEEEFGEIEDYYASLEE